MDSKISCYVNRTDVQWKVNSYLFQSFRISRTVMITATQPAATTENTMMIVIQEEPLRAEEFFFI